MTMYMVLKLLTEIDYTNPLTKATSTIKLGGCEGYVPVFKTLREAKKESMKNKYQIIAIKV